MARGRNKKKKRATTCTFVDGFSKFKSMHKAWMENTVSVQLVRKNQAEQN